MPFAKHKLTFSILTIALVLLGLFIAAVSVAIVGSGGLRAGALIVSILAVVGLFIAMPATLFALMADAVSNKSDHNLDQTYEQFAAVVNGRISWQSNDIRGKTRCVQFTHCGCTVVIDSIVVRGAEAFRQSMRFTVQLPSPSPFSCLIQRQHALDPRRLTRRDVELGSPEFDQRFWIETDQPALLRQAIAPDVQQMIVELTDFSARLGGRVHGAGFTLHVQQRGLRIEIQGAIARPDEMLEFHRLSTLLFQQIMLAI